MLRIYDVTLEVLRMLVPVIRQIERHDRDLARQLRRSATSTAGRKFVPGSARRQG